MKKYTELWEVILHEITIPLGKYAVAYDIGAIADELIVLVDAATEQSGYALDPLTLNPGPKKSAKKPATAAERKKTTKTPRKRTTKSQRTIKKMTTTSPPATNPACSHPIATGLLIAATIMLTSCSHTQEENHHRDHPLDGGGGYTVTKPEDAMPYGENYKDLANKPPQQVAEKALTNLAEAGPQELDDGSAYQRLRGVLTPELGISIETGRTQALPHFRGPEWRDWHTKGGKVVVMLEKSGEEHPPDTDTTWTRKYSVYQKLVGINSYYVHTYIVACTKISGQWRLSDIRILDTLPAPDEARPKLDDKEKTNNKKDTTP